MAKKTDKIKKFLPSKKFVWIMSICIGGCIIILAFASYFGSRAEYSKPALTVDENTTVGQLLVQDSNNNGIPDWEETLYGLDPKGDGITNKEIIDAKILKTQKDNGVSSVANSATSSTETAKLSREMLSTILALQQSGNLTPEAVQNLSDTLGQNVDVQKDNPETYTINDITTTDDNSGQALTDYAKNFNDVLGNANDNGLGKEMAVVYQTLDQNTGPQQVKNLDPYIQVYSKFASDIIALKTPQAVAQKALALANACALMAASLSKIELMYTDAVSGLIGFDEYTTAASSITAALPDLLNSLNIQISQ